MSGGRVWPRAVQKLLAAALLCLSGCRNDAVREWTPADHDLPPNAAAAPSRPSQSSASVDAQAEMVELTWQRQCASCHGREGRGDGPQGAQTQAANLTDAAWQARTSDAQMSAAITGGKGRMPRFELPPPLVDGLVKRIRARRAP
ncbi:MAG: cytochrome c [Polyangiaceae bacterium]|nr:cytochrome c [Polyangiaceae bacterium]